MVSEYQPFDGKKTSMVNYSTYYPERSGEALPMNNLALIVQRTDIYFSKFSSRIMCYYGVPTLCQQVRIIALISNGILLIKTITTCYNKPILS